MEFLDGDFFGGAITPDYSETLQAISVVSGLI